MRKRTCLAACGSMLAATIGLFGAAASASASTASPVVGYTYIDGNTVPANTIEVDDLAIQAAADALLAITAKLGQFRGESRFTTWADRFVILEVSAKIGRHFWRNAAVPLDAEDWDRLPDRFGLEPAREAEHRDLADAVRRAVDEQLTPRQRRVFVALVLNGVPLDALAAELGSNRNAIYNIIFDSRRKLRAVLVANGYLDDDTSRPS